MSAKAAVSVEEYLTTAYEFDPEYVDGELLERPLLTISHSRVQNRIGAAFENAITAALFAAPQVRLQITPTHFRVPDISVFAGAVPTGRYPKTAPFAVIEILSPEDAQSEMIDKLDEYAAMGVPYIWIVDPLHRRIHRYQDGSLLQQDALNIPEHNFRLESKAIFE